MVSASKPPYLRPSPAPQVLIPDAGKAVRLTPHASWQFLRLGRRVAGLELTFTNTCQHSRGKVALDSGDKLLWQYQGQQWRLTVAIASYQGRHDATRQQRHAYIAEHYGRWFDFTPVIGLLALTEARLYR